jgi:RNA polymerase sigma-70 factor, ECF subfamily
MQPRLYGFILKRLADQDQARDVLQRTNLVICQKAGDYKPGTSFSAWTFTITRFQLMAWRKNQSRNRLVFSDTVYEQIDGKNKPSEVDDDARVDALKECMKQLNTDERDLLDQRYRHDIPFATIASTINVSVDAIGMRLSRIRRRLAKCIQAKIQQDTPHRNQK